MSRNSKKNRTAYAHTNIKLADGNATTITMHRFLWELWGKEPTPEIDHEDHDGLNNRQYNLRPATTQQNQGNIPKKRNNTSGYKGVSARREGGWAASIARRRIGTFDDPIAAALAYDRAARNYFGDFALTNFPPEA